MSISFTHTKTSTPVSTIEACPSHHQQQQQQQQQQHAESVTITWTIRQDPLTVTLHGPAIFALAVALILSVHFLPPVVVAVLVGAVPVLLAIHNDFLNYLKLGPGGTPPTVAGYLRINWYKLWALRTPFEPLKTDPHVEPAAGILHRTPLPFRCGPHPTVVGIAPQRQTDQFGSRACYLALRRVLSTHATKHASDLGVGTSCFEKHGLGLFARFPVNNTCQGEICHVHDSDHSLHLNLHPDDAREVLAKGWGQRHPLTARCALFRMPVPRNFTMVYAPRTVDELHIVCRIVQAAGWWVMAKDLEMDVTEKGD
ncbi:hypothetical protein MGN70_005389 [Eutypa lata]|uniref:Luciferase domain-containing protein n=1 Tax=Eutypa lata (strain UCR-EL1) TaxID=1287681 RepID=M7U097_EUTLA|nr:hypothetical protein UCREL1_597 [Eutypa lata UCREL1]KAI1253181.1 hypothetical protein MGN70_005389 [Eutypa lata]